MNNIKVMVEYTAPKTDKFQALLNQYEEVKKTADETVEYYKPLANVAEEKKLELILEQLETIVGYMKQLYTIQGSKYPIESHAISNSGVDYKYFTIRSNGIDTTIYWDGYPFTMKYYAENKSHFNNEYSYAYNILGNWDKWNMYQKLEDQCIEKLNRAIEEQKSRAEKQVNRYKNIVEE